MTQEVLVNVEIFETRVAVLEDGQLQELHLARADGASVTGNIYSGRVVRVLPGMQAAFVDIGLERPGFLHAKDIRGSHWPAVEAARPWKRWGLSRPAQARARPRRAGVR